MPGSLLKHIGQIALWAMPTAVTYFMICYSPSLTSKLIGTAVTDILTNICFGILISWKFVDYDSWFLAFVIILIIIIYIIKAHQANLFLLQLIDSPPKKDFRKTVKKYIGSPPLITIHAERTPSASSSAEGSRLQSPIYFDYGSWQDVSPYPVISDSDNLRVTTAPNIFFTESAKAALDSKLIELQNNAKPHTKYRASVTCEDCADYFVSNTSGHTSRLVKVLRSKPMLALYYISFFIGYRLWFECLFFSETKDVKVQLYKCIGSDTDKLRVKCGEIDSGAQNCFQLYYRNSKRKATH